jgi:hypothetical protein
LWAFHGICRPLEAGVLVVRTLRIFGDSSDNLVPTTQPTECDSRPTQVAVLFHQGKFASVRIGGACAPRLICDDIIRARVHTSHVCLATLASDAVNRSSQVVAERPCSLKPMQVCFVRGLGSPCSQASYLAHIAPVSKGHLGPQESRRGPMKASTDRNWNRASPGHAKHAGRAYAMGPNCLTTCSAALALHASRPLAETWSCGTPTPVRDESHAKLRREFCCRPWLGCTVSRKLLSQLAVLAATERMRGAGGKRIRGDVGDSAMSSEPGCVARMV